MESRLREHGDNVIEKFQRFPRPHGLTLTKNSGWRGHRVVFWKEVGQTIN